MLNTAGKLTQEAPSLHSTSGLSFSSLRARATPVLNPGFNSDSRARKFNVLIASTEEIGSDIIKIIPTINMT